MQRVYFLTWLFIVAAVVRAQLEDGELEDSVTGSPVDRTCPHQCDCILNEIQSPPEEKNNSIRISCQNITHMPNLPKHINISHIDISFKGFPGLRDGSFSNIAGVSNIELSGEIGTLEAGAFRDVVGSSRDLFPGIHVYDGIIKFRDAQIFTIATKTFDGVNKFMKIIFERTSIEQIEHRGMSGIYDNYELQFNHVQIGLIRSRGFYHLDIGILKFIECNLKNVSSKTFSSVKATVVVFNNTKYVFTSDESSPFENVHIDNSLVFANYEAENLVFTKNFFEGVSYMKAVAFSNFFFESLSSDLLDIFPAEEVTVSHSNVSQIGVAAFQNFTTVKFDNCRVYEILGRAFTNLERILFRNSMIMNITSDAFSNLMDMEELSFYDCEINTMANAAFSNLSNIKELTFESSKDSEISLISRDAFKEIRNVNVKFKSLIIDTLSSHSIKTLENSTISLYNVKIKHLEEHAFNDSVAKFFSISYSLFKCMDSSYLGFTKVDTTNLDCNRLAKKIKTGTRPEGESTIKQCLSVDTRPSLCVRFTGANFFLTLIICLSIGAAILIGLLIMVIVLCIRRSRRSPAPRDSDLTIVPLPSSLQEGFTYSKLNESIA